MTDENLSAESDCNDRYSVSGMERWGKDEVDAWEVHLVHDKFRENPGDECLTVAAPDRETAVTEARRVAHGNPPKVGPVYNEGDMIPPELCDNPDRVEVRD